MLEDADMSAQIISTPTNVSQIDQALILATWTGSAVGTFEVQGAQVKATDIRANNPLPATIVWTALDFGSPLEAVGVDDQHQIVLNQTPFTHLRLVFNPSAGAGSLSATISGKAVGA